MVRAKLLSSLNAIRITARLSSSEASTRRFGPSLAAGLRPMTSPRLSVRSACPPWRHQSKLFTGPFRLLSKDARHASCVPRESAEHYETFQRRNRFLAQIGFLQDDAQAIASCRRHHLRGQLGHTQSRSTVNCWSFLGKINEALKQPKAHPAMAARGPGHRPLWHAINRKRQRLLNHAFEASKYISDNCGSTLGARTMPAVTRMARSENLKPRWQFRRVSIKRVITSACCTPSVETKPMCGRNWAKS